MIKEVEAMRAAHSEFLKEAQSYSAESRSWKLTSELGEEFPYGVHQITPLRWEISSSAGQMSILFNLFIREETGFLAVDLYGEGRSNLDGYHFLPAWREDGGVVWRELCKLEKPARTNPELLSFLVQRIDELVGASGLSA